MLYKSTAEGSGAAPGRREEEELQAALEASMMVSSPGLDSTVREGEAGLSSELLSSEEEITFRKDRKRSKSGQGLSEQAIGERLDQEEELTLLDSPNLVIMDTPRKRSASDQVQ